MMKLTRDYLADKLLELSGFFVVFAVGALGIMIFFSDSYEYRWVALGLVATLLLLDFITHFRTAWHNSIPKQRLLMALMTINTMALLAIPPPRRYFCHHFLRAQRHRRHVIRAQGVGGLDYRFYPNNLFVFPQHPKVGRMAWSCPSCMLAPIISSPPSPNPCPMPRSQKLRASAY